jgi:hypothetical protein
LHDDGAARHEHTSIRDLIAELGVDEVGRRYVEPGREWDELTLAVFDGTDERLEPLPLELWWEILMAALDHCPDDDGAFWLLGDGPFDHMRGIEGVDERLLEERIRNPRVARLFAAMQRELPSEGVTTGFWFQ